MDETCSISYLIWKNKLKNVLSVESVGKAGTEIRC